MQRPKKKPRKHDKVDERLCLYLKSNPVALLFFSFRYVGVTTIMSVLTKKIAQVIQTRQAQLPLVQKKVEAISQLRTQFQDVGNALEQAVKLSENNEKLSEALDRYRAIAPSSVIGKMASTMAPIEARFSRNTVNIGVSGQARVGKSTLLQAISGLDDTEIPTGEGRPVTAVQSRIQYSDRSVATIEFHTWNTFRSDVLFTAFNELGAPSATPRTLSEFSAMNFIKLFPNVPQRQRTILSDLKDAQDSIDSYESSLTGNTTNVPLKDISQYVKKAYTDTVGQIPKRKYLAVRKVTIYCPFPYEDARNLALIDLPGLGEISAGAEDRHVEGLENETDVVLMVKRPADTVAFWTEKDAAAFELIERAKSRSQHASDFLFIVKNQKLSDAPNLISELDKSLHTSLISARPDDPITILEADAKSPAAVTENILIPVLEHLAANLQRMDRELMTSALKICEGHLKQLRDFLDELDELIRSVSLPSSTQDTNRKAKKLRTSLRRALEELAQTRVENGDNYDAVFEEKIESQFRRIQEDLEYGLRADKSRDNWREQLENNRGDDSQINHGIESNYLRVGIIRYCSELDLHFDGLVTALIDEVAEVCIKSLGALLMELSGREALEKLYQLSKNLPPITVDNLTIENTAFRDTMSQLLSLKIAYLDQVHPFVSPALDILRNKEEYAVHVHQMDTDKAILDLQNLGENAAYEIKKSLLRRVDTPRRILEAALEQAIDQLIRSENYEEQFVAFVETYKDSIWPDEYTNVEVRSANIQELRSVSARALQHLQSIIEY